MIKCMFGCQLGELKTIFIFGLITYLVHLIFKFILFSLVNKWIFLLLKFFNYVKDSSYLSLI